MLLARLQVWRAGVCLAERQAAVWHCLAVRRDPESLLDGTDRTARAWQIVPQVRPNYNGAFAKVITFRNCFSSHVVCSLDRFVNLVYALFNDPSDKAEQEGAGKPRCFRRCLILNGNEA